MQRHRFIHQPLYLYFLDLQVLQLYYLGEFVDLHILRTLMIIGCKWTLHDPFVLITHRVNSLFKSGDSWKQSLDVVILMAWGFLSFLTYSWGGHGGSVGCWIIFWLLLLKSCGLEVSYCWPVLGFEELARSGSVEGLKLLLAGVRALLGAQRWSLGTVSRLSTKSAQFRLVEYFRVHLFDLNMTVNLKK